MPLVPTPTIPADITAHVTGPAARVEASLPLDERALARALRKAATITAAAGLPAEYRPAGFRAAVAVVLERELREAHD